jgi:hypothetical protein
VHHHVLPSETIIASFPFCSKNSHSAAAVLVLPLAGTPVKIISGISHESLKQQKWGAWENISKKFMQENRIFSTI